MTTLDHGAALQGSAPAFADEPLKILIADNQRLVRAGIRATLENRSEFQVVAEANDAEEAVRLVRETMPDLLIMELNMPGRGPVDLITSCRWACPGLKVFIVSAHTESKYLAPLLGVKLAGFLLKDEASENLLQAIRVVGQGFHWFSHTISQQLRCMTRQSCERCPDRLTCREKEILDLMVDGLDNSSIAKHLGMSKHTVRRYATVIYQKIGVNNRIQLVTRLTGH